MERRRWIEDVPVSIISAEDDTAFIQRAYDLGAADYISRAEVIGRRKADLFEYAEQKKRDKYTLLRSAYLAIERYRVISKQKYADILKDLIGTKDKTTGEVKIPAKYEALDDDEAFKKAEEMFERRFLMGCVRDFFYNLGYRTNKNDKHGQSVKLPNKHLKEDGYNDEFEMLYEYSLYSGKTKARGR